MSKEIVQYLHHGRVVFVQSRLKGQHREHCLCYRCKLFLPESRQGNCPIANLLYAVCVCTGVTTPVWECPEFAEKEDQ